MAAQPTQLQRAVLHQVQKATRGGHHNVGLQEKGGGQAQCCERHAANRPCRRKTVPQAQFTQTAAGTVDGQGGKPSVHEIEAARHVEEHSTGAYLLAQRLHLLLPVGATGDAGGAQATVLAKVTAGRGHLQGVVPVGKGVRE